MEVQRNTSKNKELQLQGNTRSGNVTEIDDLQIKYKERAFGQPSHDASIQGEYMQHSFIQCR